MLKVTAPLSKKHLSNGLKILRSGIDAARPPEIFKHCLSLTDSFLTISSIRGDKHTFDLKTYGNIWVVGAGKASCMMAQSMEGTLDSWITGGHIVIKYGHSVPVRKISVTEAGHPVPDENGVKGTKKIVELLKTSQKNDLVICLFSGGGSSLLVMPLPSISLLELQQCNQSLINSGADIHEINTVRKHLSQVKGGRLAEIAHPATVISLYISDVIGDNLDVIASGPTVPDTSTYTDAKGILSKYSLINKLAPSIIETIDSGQKSNIPETPKENNRIFNNIKNLVIANHLISQEAARKTACELGYQVLLLKSPLSGHINDVAHFFCSTIKKLDRNKNKPVCFIASGEPTLHVKGKGLGGRNQHLALLMAQKLENNQHVLFISCGTDGTDGPTDAAGAYATGETVKKGLKNGQDSNVYLKNFDSYHYFSKSGSLIKTGPTYTNVMDLYILIVI